MEKEVITLERENCVIRIHRPDIPEEERQRRMEAFKQAAATFMKAVYRQNQGIYEKNVPAGAATPNGHIANKSLKVYLMIEEKKRRKL